MTPTPKPMEESKRRMGFVRCGALIGFLPGFAYAVLLGGPELVRRFQWTGGGETAAWSEPLFYMVIIAFTYGGSGALVGATSPWHTTSTG